MKRMLSLILVCALVLSGCAQTQRTATVAAGNDQVEIQNENTYVPEMEEPADVGKNDEMILDSGEVPIAEGEDADPEPYKYEADFDSLNDEELMRYVEDNIYAQLVSELDSDKYLVENVSTTYVSQEYMVV